MNENNSKREFDNNVNIMINETDTHGFPAAFFRNFRKLFLNAMISGFFFGVGYAIGMHVCKQKILPRIGLSIPQ